MSQITMMRTKRKREWKENLIANLYILPIFTSVIIFALIPMIMSLMFSFTTYNPIKHDAFFEVLPEIFNGFGWYKALFTNLAYSESFKNAWLNTLFYLLAVPFSIVFGLFFSWLINYKKIRGGKIWKMLFYIPVVSGSVVKRCVGQMVIDDIAS